MHAGVTFHQSEPSPSRQVSELRRGLQHIGCIYIMCLFVRQLLDAHTAKTEVENTGVTSARLF